MNCARISMQEDAPGWFENALELYQSRRHHGQIGQHPTGVYAPRYLNLREQVRVFTSQPVVLKPIDVCKSPTVTESCIARLLVAWA